MNKFQKTILPAEIMRKQLPKLCIRICTPKVGAKCRQIQKRKMNLHL